MSTTTPTPPTSPGPPQGPPAKPPSFDRDQTIAFLAELSDPPIGCVELRVFHAAFDKTGFVTTGAQYSRTYAGWYDDLNNLAVDASRLKGVSGYVTVNPVSRDLLSRSDNRLAKARHTTTDADIVAIRWLYLDIDPIRPADISSTDAELAAAISRRDAILGDFPEMQASAIFGSSGNGAYILSRLDDLPNDADTHEFVARTLGRFADRYTDNVVKVDRTTKNPSRVALVAGTVKCKGSNRPERPWRMATIDGGLAR